MNTALFDQRESELPELFIFYNDYQVNLKFNALVTPDPELYDSISLDDFMSVKEGENWVLRGFYDSQKKEIVKIPEALHFLPDYIHMIRLPDPPQLDPEGFTRLHYDRVPDIPQNPIRHDAIIEPWLESRNVLRQLTKEHKIKISQDSENGSKNLIDRNSKNIKMQNQVSEPERAQQRRRGRRI
nr:hypothetical protein [Pedobacter sp. ASV19]